MGNSKRRTVFTVLTFMCTTLSSVVAYVGEDVMVALLTTLASVIVAWSEFVGVGRKISRYSGAITSLKETLTWWDSLNEVEKASMINIPRLVLEVETIITNEHLAWKSTSSSEKDK